MSTLTYPRHMNISVKNTLAMLVLLALLGGCDAEPPPVDTKEAPQASVQNLKATCLQCHPANAVISNAATPHITGLPTVYLAKAMRDYISGSREHPGMRNAIRLLHDEDLDTLADYYSQQTTAWRSKLPPTEARQVMNMGKAIAAGKALAAPCFSCHGDEGNSITAGVPSLAGLSVTSFIKAINDYFQDRRQSTVMPVFKHTTDDEKIGQLAAYFASRPRITSGLPTEGNVATGEALAMRSCAGCHGEQGDSLMDEYPSISGQNYSYLVAAISTYQQGTRHNELMREAVTVLSGDDIANLAAYYATRKPVAMQAIAPVKPDAPPLELAADSARTCVGCHGQDGHSPIPGTPHLSGLSQEYLAEALNQYKNGQRAHGMMKTLAARLTDVDIELISLHFANQSPLAALSRSKKANVKAQALAAACESCHGEQGISTSPNVPTLAGQDAAYLVQTMIQYKNKQRPNSEMQNAVEELARKDFNSLASYFAAQTSQQAELRVPEGPKKLAEKCNRCHGANGTDSGDPLIPRIAGQQEAYLMNVLSSYKVGSRDHSGMHAMAGVLSHWEMLSISRHYARISSTGQ